MDWDNVNLTGSYEREQDFLDGYSFDQLLLEIKCNFKKKDITKEAVIDHINTAISNRINSAYDILNSNIDNIVKQALKQRE